MSFFLCLELERLSGVRVESLGVIEPVDNLTILWALLSLIPGQIGVGIGCFVCRYVQKLFGPCSVKDLGVW